MLYLYLREIETMCENALVFDKGAWMGKNHGKTG